MYTRIIKPPKDKSFFLFGPRGTGKTTWLKSNFQKPLPKKPSRIFVNSMSEIYFWKPEWIEKTIEKTKEYPQHQFFWLTKFPDVYRKKEFQNAPLNNWFGVTDTGAGEIAEVLSLMMVDSPKWLSVEPLINKPNFDYSEFGWVIVGAMTGKEARKYQPYRRWIWEIIVVVPENTPLFLKQSLYDIFPDLSVRKEFP